MKYKIKLIGKDGFVKEMVAREFLPQVFIPKTEDVGIYFGEPIIQRNPVSEHRVFNLDREKSYKNKLIYNEI